MIKITSIQQIDELVAEQLGWQKTEVGYYNPYHPGYDRLPKFVENLWWNNNITEFLLKQNCIINFTLTPNTSKVEITYDSPAKSYCKRYIVNKPNQGQLTLCLAFLIYNNIKFELNDINNH